MREPFTHIPFVCSSGLGEFFARHAAPFMQRLVETERVAHADHCDASGAAQVVQNLPYKLDLVCLHQ